MMSTTQSFEKDKPSSPIKQLGISLNVDTPAYATAPQEMLPSSRTGNGRPATANRALRIRTTTHPSTFLDDITPVVREEGHGASQTRYSDSHDLSASSITRDSLVDHMLLSLDQFSTGYGGSGFGNPQEADDEAQSYATFGDEEPYSRYNTTKNGRGPGHGYSYSSDYESVETRTPHQAGRSRRSNSSSNFSSTGPQTNMHSDSFSQQARVLHSHGGKGSKGSSANSVDLGYAQVTGTQRWPRKTSGRSASFDYGRERHLMGGDDYTYRHDAGPEISPQSSTYDYDAAPTPTVPVGPRRYNPISPKTPQPTDPLPPISKPNTLERKRSTRSSKSAYKSRAEMNNGLGINFRMNDASHELPPMPAFSRGPAPPPLVGYGKAKEPPAPTSTSRAPVQQKERPGFFRRVFGSSSKTSLATGPDAVSSHGSTTSVETATDYQSSKPQQTLNQMRAPPQPLQAPPPPPKDQPHTLTKKPSSFFRRRKKSVSEPAMPAAPLIQQPQLLTKREDLILPKISSPVSSLRKVMNPYLSSPLKPDSPKPPNNHRHAGSDADVPRSFSPDYTPDRNATIRTVQSSSRKGMGSIDYTTTRPGMESDHLKPTTLKSGNSGGWKADDTFLQDSSDNDRPDSSLVSSMNHGTQDKPQARAAPSTSVTQDAKVVTASQRTPKLPSIPIQAERSSSDSLSKQATVSTSSPPGSATSPQQDGEWVAVTPKRDAGKETRIYLVPTKSSTESKPKSPPSTDLVTKNGEEELAKVPNSASIVYHSATSLPTLKVDGDDLPRSSTDTDKSSVVETISMTDEPKSMEDKAIPTAGDMERAKKIYDGNEDFIQKSKAAAWLGEAGNARQRTLQAYMEIYDFTNLNILASLRLLCGRLVLKAESQQVDRILDVFSSSWCRCNPDHGFKIPDVVHTICYSILLLNTDLHMADIESKMTRSQFVKNTMSTVLRLVVDAPGAFDRPTILPTRSQTLEDPPNPGKSDDRLQESRASLDVDIPTWRSSMRPSKRTETDGSNTQVSTPLNFSTPSDDCGPLVKAPFHGTLRTWEVQVEIVLKDFYNSIRADRLPLFGAPSEKVPITQPSQSSLSVFANGVLRRSPSVLSKAPSEAQSNTRGRVADTLRPSTAKWGTKNRSRPRVYPNSTMGSSRTSLDDQSSMWSPSVASSTWSKYSLGKTHTTMSVDSVDSSWPQGDYQQSIGFANALSQAIIREETVGSGGSNYSEDLRAAPLLEDESLELTGAPWAKEGILKHKHHLESVEKKAKDRTWTESFAVVEKGYMTLFSFSAKSMRNKSKGKAIGRIVGGGNWQDNAENLGSFHLLQTIASALPPPGYSKARPHVWALSLPTGAVHLFQAGTPEIVREFVSTANYWSARLSTHPLVGGISNIEYGWSDEIVNNPLVAAINENPATMTPRPSSGNRRPSMQSSIRGSFDQGTGAFRSKLPGDKVIIADWSPPTQSQRASNLMEQDQLKTLVVYVKGIEEELQKHNRLRSSMLLAFAPRQLNAHKAMANWEKKSSYLLREIVKFTTYIDCLHSAEVQKQKIYTEREAERAAKHEDHDSDDSDEGDTTLKPE